MNSTDIELPSNKRFGIFFAAVFLAASIYFYVTSSFITASLFASLTALFFIAAMIRADVLLPANKLWMRFGWLLGIIARPIVFGAIFFLIITPFGLLMRMFGRDELQLRHKKRTYWKTRDQSPVSGQDFKQQF